MKKRFITCLALLLLTASLLCSCAEGLPLSELYFAAKDATATYTTQLSQLQQGSKLIAANGESEYTIVLSRASSKPLKDAVNAFAARIEKQTEVNLLDTRRENATKRILIGTPEKDGSAPTYNAAQFYIGFSGGDLLIQAHNEIMLISALSYFTSTYLTNDCQELLLSPDLSYLSPANTYRSREHAIIRAEQSGETATQAAQSFCDTLFDTAGVRFTLKSDFNTSGTATDILFGYPDDPVAQEILKGLSFDDFYIGVRDQKLMILATNDLALSKATDMFLSTFVTAENVAFDQTNKTILLPATCDYYYRGDAVLLAEDGINRAVLIYPHNANTVTKNAAQRFAATYKLWTGTELPVYSDNHYPPNRGSFEILIGETNRAVPEQAYLQSLQSGQWIVAMTSDANALTVFANGDIALSCAMNELGKAIAAQAAAISKTPVSYDTPITDRMLYLSCDFTLSGIEPPDLPVSSTYTFFQSFYRITSREQISQNTLNYYKYYLRRCGFFYQSQEEKNGVVTTAYASETRRATLIYNKEKQTLELRVNLLQ